MRNECVGQAVCRDTHRRQRWGTYCKFQPDPRKETNNIKRQYSTLHHVRRCRLPRVSARLNSKQPVVRRIEMHSILPAIVFHRQQGAARRVMYCYDRRPQHLKYVILRTNTAVPFTKPAMSQISKRNNALLTRMIFNFLKLSNGRIRFSNERLITDQEWYTVRDHDTNF